MPEIKTLLICIVIALFCGYFVGRFTAPGCQDTVIQGTVNVAAHTAVSYTPKSPGEKTDLDVRIGKPDIKVMVNGKEATFKKADNERYALEKNKIALDQQSKVEFDIKTDQIDNTKDWAIGGGYGNHGFAGMIATPLLRPFGTWGYGDKETIAGGINIKFNWK